MPVFESFHWTQESGNTPENDGPIISVEIGIPEALEQFCLATAIPCLPGTPDLR
jgi:hypothetical protein